MKRKRLFAAMLALCVLLTLTPPGAFAEEPETVEWLDTELYDPFSEGAGGEELPEEESGEPAEEEETFSEPGEWELLDEVFVTVVTEPAASLDWLSVLDADGNWMEPCSDPVTGEVNAGIYLLRPGTYLCCYADPNGIYAEQEEAFEVEPGTESQTVVLRLESLYENILFSSFEVDPVYADIILEEDIPGPSEEELVALLSEESPYSFRSEYVFNSEVPTVYAETDMDAAAAELRRQFTEHEESITIRIESTLEPTQDSWETLRKELYNLALEHTGNPKEGDFIRYQIAVRFTGSLSRKSETTVFKYVLTPTYFTTLEQEQELDEAVERILSSLDLEGKPPYLIVRDIYDYVCENVTYDNEHDNSYRLKRSAYGALIGGQAVCQGFACALYRLFLEAGMDTRVVTRSSGEAHAWNIVLLDGFYYELDATWDRAEARRDSPFVYFLCGSTTWNQTIHDTLGDQYDDEDFAQLYPLSESDYALPSAAIHSVSLVFNGMIQMKYYFRLPDLLAADTKAALVLSRGGETVARLPLSGSPVDSESGLRALKFGVAPSLLSAPLTARLLWGDGSQAKLVSSSGTVFSQGFVFSPMEYAVQMSSKGSTPGMRSLAAAVKDYGAAAQLYFQGSSDLGPSDAVAQVTAEQLAPYAVAAHGLKPNGCTGASVSVLFEADNSLRVYFHFADGINPDSYTCQIDGVDATLLAKADGTRYLELANIPATALDQTHSFSISDGSRTYTVEASVLSYAGLAVSGGGEGIQLLAKALYLYNQAAKAYFAA